MKSKFNKSWLMAGLAQLILTTTTTHFTLASDDSYFEPLTKRKEPKEDVVSLPIRLPRVWLHKSLRGKVKVQFLKTDLSAESPVSWSEKPTSLPPPADGALADFRDFQGCLEYTELKKVALCFNVMPDVSSVGVNSKDMQWYGIETFISDELVKQNRLSECEKPLSPIQFIKAARENNQITLYLTALLDPENQCGTGPEPVQIEVELRA